jgi:hypothetical protein
MVMVPDEKRHKLEFKAQTGRLIGFDWPNTKAYLVLIEGGKIFQSRDVTVDEKFESKVDKRMPDFEEDAGIKPIPASGAGECSPHTSSTPSGTTCDNTNLGL